MMMRRKPPQYILRITASLIKIELNKSLRKESKMVQTKKQHCAFR